MTQQRARWHLGFVAFHLMSWLPAAMAGPRQDAVLVEVITAYPGASAEDVERQITIPSEVLFAGIPGLDRTLSQSLPGARLGTPGVQASHGLVAHPPGSHQTPEFGSVSTRRCHP